MNIWAYFKRKWGKNDLEVILILAIFAITGFSFLAVKPVVFDFLGYNNIEAKVWRVLAYVVIMYPLYSLLLLIWGTIFGQFKFFWGFIGKMNRRLIPRIKKQ